MKIPIGIRKSLAVVAAAAAIFAFYFAVARPWFLRWGSTDAEVAVARPGDDLVPGAKDRTTRAVTIAAPAATVWPWLAQLGQDRSGFYSYEVLEDLVGGEMPRRYRLMPQHQEWNPGDRLWMYPPEKAGGAGSARLVACEPGRHLVFAMHQIGTPPSAPKEDGIWGFVLEPIDAHTTRLIAYGRAAGPPGPFWTAFVRGVFEPAHYVMERRMLLTIKALAEGRMPSKVSENTAVVVWTVTVALIVAALIEAVRRPHWKRALAMAVVGALLFQALTLLQPPAAIGVATAGALAALVWWAGGRTRPLRVRLSDTDLPWAANPGGAS